MYASKYLDKEIIDDNNDSIKRKGFVEDSFLSNDPDISCWGLNISITWPFLQHFRKKYGEFVSAFELFKSDVYFYPFENTHTTLLTIINFKKHQCLKQKERENLEEKAKQIIEYLKPVF